MIWEVDQSLEALLRAEVLRDAETDVVFDAPTTEWAARLAGPVIDAFLYDIHEDVERRHAGTPVEKDENGRVTGRRPPTRYYKLSYLLTAWTTQAADEHRLLGRLLENLIRFEKLPEEHLRGRLAGLSIPVSVAMPQPDRTVSDLWSAVGGDMKPSLELIALVPIVPAVSYVAGPPVDDMALDLLEKPEPKPVEKPNRGRPPISREDVAASSQR